MTSFREIGVFKRWEEEYELVGVRGKKLTEKNTSQTIYVGAAWLHVAK